MKTSESIKSIAAALCVAQSEMTGAKKGAANPFFKSKYSDLSMVMKAVSQPFANNGLSFVQAAEFNSGMVSVTTLIMHESGEWIESLTELPPVKNDAQGFGSAISYAKRYGLQALAGVPSVDDDGNDAVKHTIKQPTKAQLKTKWNPTIDQLWQHYQNNDIEGCHEVTNELTPTEKSEVWSLLPGEVKNFLAKNKEAKQ